ncbi:MAG: hypothetical protein RIK87_21695 [Fuerstiella sp.]
MKSVRFDQSLTLNLGQKAYEKTVVTSMSQYPIFDRTHVRLQNLAERASDVRVADVRKPAAAPHRADTLRLAAVIQSAREHNRPVVVMFGGHLVKLGLSSFLIDLIDEGFITCVSTNGAGIIHDFELAAFGETSENVSTWIKQGQFGLWRETDQLNEIVKQGAVRNEGFGEAVGRHLEETNAPYRSYSIAAAAWRKGIPMTCHVSIGCDIFHGYANCDGAALGQVSHTDFLIFARQIQDLEGGVFLNIGSAVTGPEVYLKALSMARNVARQRGETITDFTTAVFDVVDLPENWQDGPGQPPQGPGAQSKPHPLYYFRPWKTILCRTIQDGGKSFYVKGDHRETIPALWQALIHSEATGNECASSDANT